MFATQGRLLVDAMTAAGRPPTVVRMPDTDHIRSGAAFGDAGSALFAAARSAVSDGL